MTGKVLTVLFVAAVGWRTDGTGRYPAADPVTEWSAEKNVVWKTPLAKWSNATPVIVGDRLFVCAETETLVCLNLADGNVLWQRANPLIGVLPAEQRAEAEQQAKRYDQVQKKLKPLRAEMGKLNRRNAALKKKLKKAPDDQNLKNEVADLKKKIGELKKQMSPLQKTLGGLAKYRRPGVNATNGYSSSTPASDGRNVYVVFATGVAACYDLDGKRKWARFIEKPRIGDGHCASPLLAGDKLLVHFVNMVALDKQTGRTVWTAKSGARFGSPVLTKIGGVGVVVTAGGDFIRVSDGKVLAKKQSVLTYNAPIVHEGVAYFIQHGGKGLQLPAEAADKLETKALWTTKPKKDRYYASPLLHDGLLYAVTQTGQLSAIDAKTGKVVYTQALKLGGTAYPSIALAGKYIFVSSDNGVTAVLDPGRAYKEIARNKLEMFRSSPVFHGKRMYIRAYKHVYCIGQ